MIWRSNSKMNFNSYQNGRWAEFWVCNFLRLKGYKILTQNYKTGRGTQAGEIDIIACQKQTIVFVEVKKRKNMDSAAYAIQPKQKQRIINGAQAFLQKNPQYSEFDCRFDAVLVVSPLKMCHIPNAWQVEEM